MKKGENLPDIEKISVHKLYNTMCPKILLYVALRNDCLLSTCLVAINPLFNPAKIKTWMG